MAPTVANAAASKPTRAGTRTHRLPGTTVEISVDGVALAPARDTVARHQVRDALADLEHDAGGRVAEPCRFVQPRSHPLNGGSQAVALGLLQHLLDLVGSRARLADQALPAGLDLRAFGTCAEEARPHVDEDAVRRHRRCGHVEDLDAAVAHSLRHLLHRGQASPGTSAAIARASGGSRDGRHCPRSPVLVGDDEPAHLGGVEQPAGAYGLRGQQVVDHRAQRPHQP